MITKEEVVMAFRFLGWEPVQKKFIGIRCCCGLSAVAAYRNRKDPVEIWKAVELLGPTRVVQYFGESLSLTPSYTRGFIEGWDDQALAQPEVQEHWDGYRDGIICWQAVQLDRLQSPRQS